MVKRNTLKIKAIGSIVVPAIAIAAASIIGGSSAFATCNIVNGVTTCTSSTTFNVNVSEVLTVSITEPQAWASGASNSFLRNKVNINIVSNNSDGVTATMTTSNSSPSLVNSVDGSTISTISGGSGVALANASGNSWGYSIVNANATEPTQYFGMVGLGSTPIEIVSTNAPSSVISKDIYFGAKSDGTIASGTYESGVLISVVTGVVDTGEEPTPVNPVTPVNPITPSDDTTPNDNTATEVQAPKGNTQYGAVVATTITDDDLAETTTTTTESYAKPAGVNRTAVISDGGSPLAAGLAATAVASATAGTIFFIIAKRRRDEDEEEDEGLQQQ